MQTALVYTMGAECQASTGPILSPAMLPQVTQDSANCPSGPSLEHSRRATVLAQCCFLVSYCCAGIPDQALPRANHHSAAGQIVCFALQLPASKGWKVTFWIGSRRRHNSSHMQVMRAPNNQQVCHSIWSCQSSDDIADQPISDGIYFITPHTESCRTGFTR